MTAETATGPDAGSVTAADDAGLPLIEIDRPARGVALVRIDPGPEGLMDAAAADALAGAVAALDGDAAVRAVVLTGAVAGMFVRHYSLIELAATAGKVAASGRRFNDLSRPVKPAPFNACLDRIQASSKPWIAALNGWAMGGGFELALACDLRIGLDGPWKFGLPEVRAGLLPGGGGTQRLTRLLGEARALDFVLRGRIVSPAEAERLGLLSALVPAGGDVVAAAVALAADLAALPGLGVAHAKRLVRTALDGTLEQGLGAERTLFVDTLTDADTRAVIGRMAAEADGRIDDAALTAAAADIDLAPQSAAPEGE
ncbi:enoyl-CoA hydratase/isomerase family protein [Tistrella bauzanensis]|uniref:enoyl-CoA hydratase/isomerase family protein n=1 Tax=Tistrella TaxID=171436 RepID=UPI0031F6A20D